MEILSGQSVADILKGMISDKTQVHEFCVDLTVAEIHILTKRGSLDFGGSEYVEASTKLLRSKVLKPEDKYGWWELQQGVYLLRYNESLQSQNFKTGNLAPHPRLIAAGASHNSVLLSPGDNLQSLLSVSKAGCALKQNCRVSRLQLVN